MARVAETARECLNCRGHFGHLGDLCQVWHRRRRANGQIALVEDVADLWAMERGGALLPGVIIGSGGHGCPRFDDYSGRKDLASQG